MPDDYHEIDDRYDRMTKAANDALEYKQQQEDIVRERNKANLSSGLSTASTSGSPPGKSTGVGIFGGIVGCVIIVLVILVALYIFGWALATFVVK